MQVALRPWQEEDIPAVALYANNPKLAENLRDPFPTPYTLEDARWFVEHSIRCEAGDRERPYAITVDGALAGSITLSLHLDIRPVSAEIGYWLGEPFWNRGVMSEAIPLLCREAFLDKRLQRLFAEVFPENAASCRVLTKCGFSLLHTLEKCVPKGGEYRDCATYELHREEWEGRERVFPGRE